MPRVRHERAAVAALLVGGACLATAAGGPYVPNPASLREYATALAAHPAGGVVLTGLHLRGGGIEPACDFFATRLVPDGSGVAWRTEFADCETDESIVTTNGEQVFVDPAGDVVVGKLASGWFQVLKLAGTTGQMVWSQVLGGHAGDTPGAHATAVDAAGDIVVGGGLGGDFRRTNFVVAKLDGASGARRWRRTLQGGFRGTEDHEAFNEAWAVATDARRDVLASGVIVKPSKRRRPFRRWTILKLAGNDGKTRWRRDLGETYPVWGERAYRSLAVDDRGDVLAVADTTRRGAPSSSVLSVVKLDGASGEVRWRRILDRWALGAAMLAAMPGGDVAVAGRQQPPETPPRIVVAVLDGATGRRRWRRIVAGSAGLRSVPEPLVFDQPAALVADAEGAVFLAGVLRNTDVGSDFTVVAFDARTGAERWRRVIDGDAHANDGARALALAGGDVIAAGEIESAGADVDAMVLSVGASSGAERWRLRCDATSCR